MRKTIFIIPGFRQYTSDDQYAWLLKYLQLKGFKITLPRITWDRHVMSDYAKEFVEFYEKNKDKKGENYVWGFSFGGMIAYISAAECKPDKLFLCSMSAYFKEDIPYLKSTYKKSIGHRRVDDFKKFSAEKIAQNVTCPTVIIYGSKEGSLYPRHKYRNEKTAELVHNSSLCIAQDAPHRIDFPSYIQEIKSQIE